MQIGCTLCSLFLHHLLCYKWAPASIVAAFYQKRRGVLVVAGWSAVNPECRASKQWRSTIRKMPGQRGSRNPILPSLLVLQAQNNQTLSSQHWVILITRLKAVILRGTIRSWSAMLNKRHCSFFVLHFTPRAVTQNPLAFRTQNDSTPGDHEKITSSEVV